MISLGENRILKLHATLKSVTHVIETFYIRFLRQRSMLTAVDLIFTTMNRQVKVYNRMLEITRYTGTANPQMG
jgi:hypothetical protein